MDPAEIVVHEVECDRMAVVIDLLAESIGQPRRAERACNLEENLIRSEEPSVSACTWQ